MYCSNHKNKQAFNTCEICKKKFCDYCSVIYKNKILCNLCFKNLKFTKKILFFCDYYKKYIILLLGFSIIFLILILFIQNQIKANQIKTIKNSINKIKLNIYNNNLKQNNIELTKIYNMKDFKHLYKELKYYLTNVKILDSYIQYKKWKIFHHPLSKIELFHFTDKNFPELEKILSEFNTEIISYFYKKIDSAFCTNIKNILIKINNKYYNNPINSRKKFYKFRNDIKNTYYKIKDLINNCLIFYPDNQTEKLVVIKNTVLKMNKDFPIDFYDKLKNKKENTYIILNQKLVFKFIPLSQK
jgi:hypothetical protein